MRMLCPLHRGPTHPPRRAAPARWGSPRRPRAGCAAQPSRQRVCSCSVARPASPAAADNVAEGSASIAAPSSATRSNLRSARSSARGSATSMPSFASRNGRYRSMPMPRSSAIDRTSRGVPRKPMKSGSQSSTASKRAAAAASSLSRSVPLMQSVAMDRRICLCPQDAVAINDAPDRPPRDVRYRFVRSRQVRANRSGPSSRSRCRCGSSMAQITLCGKRPRMPAISTAPSPGYSRSSRIVRRASSIVAGTSGRSSQTWAKFAHVAGTRSSCRVGSGRDGSVAYRS